MQVLPWFTEIATILGLFSVPGKIILPNQLSGGLCFNQVYYAMGNAYFDSRVQAREIHKKLYDYYGIEAAVCPPAKILVVRRQDEFRDYFNLNTVKHTVEKFGYPVDYFHFNANLTAREQALKISQYGLIISPHGSQLANLIFAQQRAAVIELVPMSFGVEFYRVGRGNSMHYQLVEQGYPVSSQVTYEEFLDIRAKVQNGEKPGPKFHAIKNAKYAIDPTALETAINNSLAYLKNISNCSNWKK